MQTMSDTSSLYSGEIDVDDFIAGKVDFQKKLSAPRSPVSVETKESTPSDRRKRTWDERRDDATIRHRNSEPRHLVPSLRDVEEGGFPELAEDGDAKLPGSNVQHIDALILGLERTFFAAMNNAWLLVMGGIGLMSVGSNDTAATNSGIFILASGIVCAGLAYIMYIGRVTQLKRKTPFQFSHTVLWMSLVTAVTISALALELHYGTLYPYLERRAAVVVYNDTSAPIPGTKEGL